MTIQDDCYVIGYRDGVEVCELAGPDHTDCILEPLHDDVVAAVRDMDREFLARVTRSRTTTHRIGGRTYIAETLPIVGDLL